MDLAALNPFSRLRGAIRGLLASDASTDAVLDAIGAVATEVRGARQDIADLRGRFNFVEDAAPVDGKGRLSGDPTRPRPCRTDPRIEGHDGRLGPHRTMPNGDGRRLTSGQPHP